LSPLDDDVWYLYNTPEDFSLVNNLAVKYPKKIGKDEKPVYVAS